MTGLRSSSPRSSLEPYFRSWTTSKSYLLLNMKPGMKPYTVEPRYNEGPGDWQNLFAITRFRYIQVLFHMSYYYWGKENRLLYRGVRCMEVRSLSRFQCTRQVQSTGHWLELLSRGKGLKANFNKDTFVNTYFRS